MVVRRRGFFATGPRGVLSEVSRYRERLALAFSLFALSLFVLQVDGSIDLSVKYLLVPLFVYPVVRLVAPTSDRTALDALYLGLLFLGFSGILLFGTRYPIGFPDVYNHLAATRRTIVDGRVVPLRGVSRNFVGLYVLTGGISALGDVSIHAVARVLPLVTFPLTVLVFYHGIARRMLGPRAALFTTLAFALNWGVFRFSVEFRTLAMAFPLMLVILSLLLREFEWRTDGLRAPILVVVLVVGLVLTHFTTILFYTAFMIVLATVFFAHKRKVGPLFYLLFSLAVLWLYMAYVGGTFDDLQFFVDKGQEVYAKLIGTSEQGGNVQKGTQGAVGLTYGRQLFYTQWIIRGAFVGAFGVFSLYWFKTREWFDSFVVFGSVAMGVSVVATVIVAAFLNPGRVFTYFAIPYAFAYGGGLFIADRLSTDGVRSDVEAVLTIDAAKRVACVVAAVLLVVMLFTTVMKFPTDVVGDTQPIRDESSVDDLAYLEVDAHEIATRSFVYDHLAPSERVVTANGRKLDVYQIGAGAAEESFSSTGYVVGGVHEGQLASPNATARVYDNGETQVYRKRPGVE